MNKRSLPQYVLLRKLCATFLVLSVVGACGAQPDLPTTQAAASNAYAKIEKPDNIAGIFRNLGFAIDHQLLLREDFYTEEKLTHFFGGDKIIWRKPRSAGVRWGFVSGFGKTVERFPMADGSSLEGLTVAFAWDVDADYKSKATWLIAVTSPAGIDFAGVEAIFGRRWKEAPPLPPSIHGVFRAPTREHGNDRIVYSFNRQGVKSQFTFAFRADATLDDVVFSVEGKTQP